MNIKIYAVNLTPDEKGYNEVHETSCSHAKSIRNFELLGCFTDEIKAVENAKARGYNADGCYYCCRNAHKG